MSTILTYTLQFCIVDALLTDLHIAGSYYLLHFMANAYIVVNTFDHVLLCFANLHGNLQIPIVYGCIEVTAALHLYHIIIYHPKFRLDDWLHHILMVFFALPATALFTTCGIVVSHGLFFTTGLPGGIDYLLLFLVRNEWLITRETEKRVNTWLNVWVRCPGCILTASFVLMLLQLQMQTASYASILVYTSVMATLYWNGVYFMNSAAKDYYSNYL
jgi:hypothetical protein